MLKEFTNEPFTDFSIPENRKEMEKTLKKVHSAFPEKGRLYIDGKWVESASGETFTSINPSKKEEIIGHYQKGNEKDGERALEAATKAFEEWRFYPPEERAALILKAAKRMRERKNELSAWMVYETGKNWAEADGDTAEAIDYLEYYPRQMLRLSGNQPLTPYPPEFNEYYYIPLGPVVVIPPWNFPAAILVGMTSAALVTGNTVVLKPASDSPGVATRVVELFEEVGIPKGVLNLVTGPGASLGNYLVTHPKTRMIAFTGSKAVGLKINELAAKLSPGQIWIKRVIAEMGGKDPLVVAEDADLEAAAAGVVTSAYGFQGQKCSAGSRLIAVEAIYDKLIEMVVEKAKKLKVGPGEENFPVGPVINQAAETKVMTYIDIGKKEAKLILGGKKAREDGFYIEPTIFVDVPENARIAQEEIFGPFLSIIKAKDYDDALRIANGTVYGLTGAVFTKDRGKIQKAKRLFHVGNLYINRKCTGALVDVHPFGGFNMSGTDSKAGGRDYLLLFLQGKSISERL